MPPAFPHIAPLGDRAVVARLGARADDATLERVVALSAALDKEPPRGMTEYVPAYATVTVFYDPAATGYGELRAALASLCARAPAAGPASGDTVVVPVCYGGELGPDLAFVAAHTGLSQDEVVELHAGATYRVVMVGFLGGFPYLSGLPARLCVPRLERPRPAVPAGSVAIAGEQAGIYPLQAPGGWRVIGRTPRALFDPARPEPAVLKVGDRVRFEPIGPADFERLAGGKR